jgi:hypothetical protein
MFVMVMSVRTKTVAETVSKEININHKNNLNNINCINNHQRVIESSNISINTNNNIHSIDKTIKKILPISVDTSTILSPSTLTTSAQSAQNPNKYIFTELNNNRQPQTIQVIFFFLQYYPQNPHFLQHQLHSSKNHQIYLVFSFSFIIL